MRAARRPVWASEVTRSGMPMPRSLRPGEEVSPVNLGFAEGATDAEDHALAVVSAHANGDESGAVADIAIYTNFVVGGVEGEVLDVW